MTRYPRLPLETWGRLWLERVKARADRAAWSRYGFEFLMFGFKQAWACLFGGLMLVMIVGTFGRAWAYPGQEAGWEMVGLEKLGSWFLLMIISIVLVSIVHRPEREPT